MNEPVIMLPGRYARHELIGLGLITLAVIGIYSETMLSMIAIWVESDAFSHGFLVFPICAWLAWRTHSAGRFFAASPALVGVLVTLSLSLGWWLGDVVGVQVVKQLALIAMVPAVVLTIYGPNTVRKYAFTLAYLVFAVPFGEFLLPYLIDFTAWFTVDSLNLFGVPVFRDGPYFSTPAGNFEVAKACAGLKYLIATLALTVLFSRFLFKNAMKAMSFIGIAVLLSIIANAVRATAIVLLLQYTDLDIAAGTGHELVGWTIYALLLLGIVWTGLHLRDNVDNHSVTETAADIVVSPRNSRPGMETVRAGVFAVIALMTGPVLTWAGNDQVNTGSVRIVGLPSSIDGWIGEEFSASDWRPDFWGAAQIAAATYKGNGQQVDVVVLLYDNARQGVELSNSANRVADEAEWHLQNTGKVNITIADTLGPTFAEVLAIRPDAMRLIWSWMQVNSTEVNSLFAVKLEEAVAKLSGQPVRSAAIILSISVSQTEELSREALAAFITAGYPAITDCLNSDLMQTNCSLGIVQEGL